MKYGYLYLPHIFLITSLNRYIQQPPIKYGAQYKKLCLEAKLSITNLSVKKYILQKRKLALREKKY